MTSPLASRIPGWEPCQWPLGCTATLKPGIGRVLCSPHEGRVRAEGHGYLPDPEGRGDVPGWRPCAVCGERQPFHRLASDEAEAAVLMRSAVKVRHDARPTSAAAAESAAPSSGTQRWRVLQVIVGAGEQGATDEDVMAVCGITLNSIRPRRLELLEGGYVIDSGDTRPMQSGQQGTVWLATLDGVTALAACP